MTELSSRNQLYLGLFLAVLLLGTRSTHFTALHHLPSAAWAVFFLVGVFLRPAWAFPLFYGAVSISDILSIALSDGPHYCVFTPAYAMLLPAFGALWFAGRLYARFHQDRLATLPFLTVTVLIGAVVAELLSSGGFYVFSGRFADPTFAEFGTRFVRYFPANLKLISIYMGFAVILYVAALAVRGNISKSVSMADGSR